MDILTISFLIVMGLLFLVSIPAQFANPPSDGSNSRWGAFGAAAPGLLTTIGVFGTFVGILLGLQGFYVEHVDESVPQFLDGLKTAFWTSAAGLGWAIVLRFVQPLSRKSSSAVSDDPADILRSIEPKIAEQTKALSGGEDTSLLTQLQKLRTSLIDASEAQKKSTDDGFQKQLESFESFAAKIA